MTTKLAKDIMTTNVLLAVEDWSLAELARFLTDHAISGAPVVDGDGKLVGVVSVTDVARAAGDSLGHWVEPTTLYHHESRLGPAQVEKLANLSSGELSVRDIMTSVVFQVNAGDSIGEAAHMMVTGRIHRVFVVEQGRVVGVVSALDLLSELCD